MATGNRKSTSGRKKTAQNRRRTNSGQKKRTVRSGQQPANAFTKEIVLWIVIAVSILLFISNFGIGGIVGNAVSRFFFGIFGLIAYVFPIVLLIGTFFAVSNKGNAVAAVKIVAACLFVMFLCMLMELFAHGADTQLALQAYKTSFKTKSGGGLIGGFLAHMLCSGFGLVGAYVIAIIILIISLVLITERSAFRGMQKSGKKVYESAKSSNERHREKAESRREERKIRRMDRKVSGVAIDTRVLPEADMPESDEMGELYAEPYLDIPEIKEEEPIPLQQEETQPADEFTPSAFSDEALEAIMRQEMTELQASVAEIPIVQSVSPVEVTPKTIQPEQPPVMETAEQPQSAENFYQEPERRHSGHTKQSAAEIADNVSEIADEIQINSEPIKKYIFPSVDLLSKPQNKKGDSRAHLQETAMKLQQTLKNFGVNVTITNISCGPAVTRYELQPEMGVKVSKIVNLADDIKLNLAAADIRIEAPIPGKAAIGIEVPNKENVVVPFRELIESQEFQSHASKIAFGVGKDIAGKVMVSDIAKMPHLLIAGATGSGKSVCINTIIMSILYKADPKEVKLIMIDPKVVELSVYNGIPHLMIPVVTDPKKAAGALHWAVSEMMERYDKFAAANVRDLKGYNAKIESLPTIEGDPKPEKLPQLVIIVDELADLMMVAPSDVESAICRLAQLARAAGIHLIIATQRPSVNVITGLIKANMPSRIAFAVTSGIDSRTILDMNGAEKLLGKGDMLFNPQGAAKPIRVQGAFVSDKEVGDVVEFIKEQNGQVAYNSEIEEKMNSIESADNTVSIDGNSGVGDGRDAYFADAARLLIDKEKGSIGMLQRYFKVGFNRAARIMDQLEEAGIVGPEEGTKPRRVLMSAEQFEQFEEEEL